MAQNENEFGEYSETPEPQNESGPMKELREALERAEKKNQKLEQQLEKAPTEAYEKAKTQIERESQASSLATKLGYPKLGARFLKDNPEAEVTEETFRTFVTEDLGLPVKEAEAQEQQEPKQEPQQIGTGNVAGFHQGGGTPTGQKRYTGAEALAAYNRGEISVEDFTRALDDGSIHKGDPGYVVHKQPG